MTRLLLAAAWVALAVALLLHPVDRDVPPAWLDEACALASC